MIAWTFLFSFINSNYPLVAQRKKSFPHLGLNLLTTCMVCSTDLWTNSWLLDWYLCFVQSRTKRLGQRASSPLPPLTMLIIGWFFLFLLEETWYFPTLIRGDGGYVIRLNCPNYFCLGLSERVIWGIFWRRRDAGDWDKG